MKKNVAIVAIALLTQGNLPGQNTPRRQTLLLDAIRMEHWLNLRENAITDSAKRACRDSALTIYLPYVIDLIPGAPTVENAKGVASENPFLKTFPGLRPGDAANGVDGGKLGPIKNLGKSAANLDVTNLAVGLSDFLIERAKTELNTAFFRRFQQELDAPKFSDLKILFPETSELLNVLGTEIYKYDAYLNNLRIAFHNDLDDLLEHAPDVVRNHKNGIQKLKGVYPGLLMALSAAYELDRGTVPGRVAFQLAFEDDNMDDLATEVPGTKPWVNGLRTAVMVSESFRDSTDDGRYWVSEEVVRQLLKKNVFKVYLGLLYEWSLNSTYDRIEFDLHDTIEFCLGHRLKMGPAKLNVLLKNIGECWEQPHVADSLKAFRTFFLNMGRRVNDVQQDLATFQATKEEVSKMDQATPAERRRLLFEAFNDVVSSTLDVMDEAHGIEDLPYIRIKVPPEADKYIAMVRIAQRLAASVSQKQYGSAVTHMADLMRKVWTTPDGSAAADTVFMPAVVQRVLKYGSFMASLIEADSPETARKAIEAAALPPGSYSIKRDSRSSVALNGYLGFFAGHEDQRGAENADGRNMNNLSLTAPIGISISWGNNAGFKGHSSYGFLFSLIDLGTVASFRLDDSTAQEVPTITLANLVSPGVFFEWGIGGTPLTLGLGLQAGPRLRELTSDEAIVGDAYVRYGLTLKVDIPLLHFSASPPKQ